MNLLLKQRFLNMQSKKNSKKTACVAKWGRVCPAGSCDKKRVLGFFVMDGKKRTFRELRFIILLTLLSGQQTTNQISIRTSINWRTVESHLTFLVGKGLVNEVFKSEYVRIFKLTEQGENHANSLLEQEKKTGEEKIGKKEQEVVTL